MDVMDGWIEDPDDHARDPEAADRSRVGPPHAACGHL